MYIRVWEYDVTVDRVDAFVAAYDGEGDWARLFRRGDGYLGTELFRRTGDGGRFVTVDRWTDEAAWRAFLDTWGEAYAQLDATLTSLSTSQRPVLEAAG